MRGKELLRLVWINITQNKFKAIMTSIGIVVGAATIVMVIAIGKGGQADVADQFKNLNAGAIDISYQGNGSTSSNKTSSNNRSSNSSNSGNSGMSRSSSGNSSSGGAPSGEAPSGGGGFGGEGGGNFGGFGNASGSGSAGASGNAGSSNSTSKSNGSSNSSNSKSTGNSGTGESGFPGGGGFGGGFGGNFAAMFGNMENRMNQKKVTLTDNDVNDIETFVSGINAATISYSTKKSVDGGDLDEATSYTIAGVKSNYESISNLGMSVGDFITDANETSKDKVCVLGYDVAQEIFGSSIDAYGSIVYIDSRAYVVNGVLKQMGTVSSGISPDESIFIPYATGEKYITGTSLNPTITVLADDVNNVSAVTTSIKDVLSESYPNTEFTYTDAGSKMQAALASNKILTMLLTAMAAIVFLVGGIGIMNVLFVSVKERTNEIGILKAIGCSKRNILFEFLLEASAISLIGGVIGVALSFAITPLVEYLGVRVELSPEAFIIAIVFAVLTGTVFGFYPAYKASKLVPVEALNAE